MNIKVHQYRFIKTITLPIALDFDNFHNRKLDLKKQFPQIQYSSY